MLSRLLSWFRRPASRPPSRPAAQRPSFSTRTPDSLADFDRQAIRDWFAHPTTQLVLSLVENTHPGRNLPSMLPKSEADKDAAVCLLNRVRGWEIYRNTLLNLLATHAPGGDVEETYPNS